MLTLPGHSPPLGLCSGSFFCWGHPLLCLAYSDFSLCLYNTPGHLPETCCTASTPFLISYALHANCLVTPNQIIDSYKEESVPCPGAQPAQCLVHHRCSSIFVESIHGFRVTDKLFSFLDTADSLSTNFREPIKNIQ